MNIDALLPERLRARHAGHRAHFAQRPRVRPMAAMHDLVALHRDGSEIPVEVSLSPLEGTEGARVIASIRDVREKVRLETAVRQERERMDALMRRAEVAEHLAALGTLTTGIAHEITSPLTYVLGNLQLGARHLDRMLAAIESTASPSRELQLAHQAMQLRTCVSEAMEGGERMRLIVGDLRTLGRADPPSRALCDVRQVTEAALRITMAELVRRAEVVRDLGAAPPVRGSATRLGQVVINLLINAAQALPDPRAPASRVIVRCGADGTDSAFIEVEDNGAGIPAEHLPRVFDRFFTTKPVGEGTGLGLAICERIVRDLGGTITLASEIGRGTTVRVRLPTGRRSSIPSGMAAEGGSSPPTRG